MYYILLLQNTHVHTNTLHNTIIQSKIDCKRRQLRWRHWRQFTPHTISQTATSPPSPLQLLWTCDVTMTSSPKPGWSSKASLLSWQLHGCFEEANYSKWISIGPTSTTNCKKIRNVENDESSEDKAVTICLKEDERKKSKNFGTATTMNSPPALAPLSQLQVNHHPVFNFHSPFLFLSHPLTIEIWLPHRKRSTLMRPGKFRNCFSFQKRRFSKRWIVFSEKK